MLTAVVSERFLRTSFPEFTRHSPSVPESHQEKRDLLGFHQLPVHLEVCFAFPEESKFQMKNFKYSLFFFSSRVKGVVGIRTSSTDHRSLKVFGTYSIMFI